ncbi:helix-turn-helix domain-containing protein [Rosistilla oblonga]|uniref:helix-turn-helix domain-containing protein n=1 Tax=Rosistilla oblonga TaxID=2527990 RepID=UPI003A96BCB9
MAVDTTVSRYRAALLQEAELEKRLIDARTERQICEKMLALRGGRSDDKSDNRIHAEELIAKHADRLEPSDWEMLDSEFCTTGEAARYTGLSATSIKRYCDRGDFATKRSSMKRRLISTVSLVEFMINGKTEETS